ncbi:DUF1835 domain-containing protein [Neobacillus drentensis]|uniref:DUF1835 domain-containing protein n=1 Tax=Neobacillus drentensis TaxID=220684 RepID=UPI002FFE3E7C
MSERGEWQTYELHHSADFDTFYHEEQEPLEGSGYFVQQHQLGFMAEKINQLIQRQRKKMPSADFLREHGPVHLVSSSSTAGALRYGLERPKKVIGFQEPFAIGPLWKFDSKIGQDYRYEWLSENINFELEVHELENYFSKTVLEIEDIPDEIPVYIWTANNGDEQTWLRFILFLLRDKPNEMILINTTEQWSEDEGRSMIHSAWLHPEQLKALFDQNKTAKPLSNEERVQFQEEWEQLSQTKEVLRLWQNGRITSVPEDYFDGFIIQTIEQLHQQQEPKEFIRAGEVIGEILGQLDELVSDCFFEYRIRHLIYNGVLELKGIPKSMRHYRVKLRG